MCLLPHADIRNSRARLKLSATTVDMDKTDVLVTIVVWYPGGAYYLVNRRTAQLV